MSPDEIAAFDDLIGDEDPVPDPVPTTAGPEWMYLTVHAPREVVDAVLEMLENQHDFRSIHPLDWCAHERPQDFARVDWSPAEPAVNQLAVDWRKSEGRDDVRVALSDPTDRQA